MAPVPQSKKWIALTAGYNSLSILFKDNGPYKFEIEEREESFPGKRLFPLIEGLFQVSIPE